MSTEPKKSVRGLPQHSYAHPIDRPMQGYESGDHGHGNGVAWYEVFRDRETCEVYCVRCYDSERSSKMPYSWADLAWREACYRAIIARTRTEAVDCPRQIELSRHEWHIVLDHTVSRWLDGDTVDTSLDEGQVRHARGDPDRGESTEARHGPRAEVVGRRSRLSNN